MQKKYLIVIYGKDGCEKCARLKLNVKALLANESLGRDFDMDYQNLSTAEGMAAYAAAETINGQRLPGLQIMKYNEGKRTYTKIADPRPESFDAKTKKLFVPSYLQLQTDYYGSYAQEISDKEILELADLAIAAG